MNMATGIEMMKEDEMLVDSSILYHRHHNTCTNQQWIKLKLSYITHQCQSAARACMKRGQCHRR